MPPCTCRIPRVATKVPTVRTVGGVQFHAALAGERCPGCDDTRVPRAVLERFELAVAADLTRAGVFSADALRFQRKALGFSVTAFAALIDVATETVSRWETGKVPAPILVSATLGALALDRLAGRTVTAEALRALLHPSPPGTERHLPEVPAAPPPLETPP